PGLIVTVRDEIEALQKYIELQSIRYEGELDFQIDVDPRTNHIPIPRFLLQPLVENAIYHGKNEQFGIIRITIQQTEQGKMRVEVADNGPGMDEATLTRLINTGEGTPVLGGMGIGLNYVRRLLDRYYGNGDLLHITSEAGQGTILSVEIPAAIEDGRMRFH
ncbi:sensor histidine kinase, partial [Paenibacillus sp. MCAF20]